MGSVRSRLIDRGTAYMNGFVGLAAGILFVVSAIHVYWAFGGRWGGQAALPQKTGGGALFVPRMPETLTVAVLLAVIAFMLMAQAGWLSFWGAGAWTRWGCALCALAFFVRAVGDFRYLGFFKRIKHTTFAENDTRLYSPLCLVLAVAFAVVLM